MFQGDCRQLLAKALGFLSEGGKRLAAGKIGTVPEVQQVVPSKKRLGDRGGELPVNEPESLDVFQKLVVSARPENGVAEFRNKHALL